MLGPENIIVHYGEVALFEDELGDKGYSKCYVRFRVMSDCFFVLLRSYTRVDHVLVRILDTRIFCKLVPDSLGEPIKIIRDF
jgi:type 2A phosphatase activator TIP41